MKSRYSAYAVGDAGYIIKTTHPNNADYQQDNKRWKEDILDFCKATEFLGLTIVDFRERETEAFVTFYAQLSSGEMREQSRFLKSEGKWLYESGVYE